MVQAASEGEGKETAPEGPNTNGMDGLPTGSLSRMADGRAVTYMKGIPGDEDGSGRIADKGGGSVMHDEDRKKQVILPQTGAAERALAEAEARRAAIKRVGQLRPREVNGRQGPEPVRYGDWENKGIASDF